MPKPNGERTPIYRKINLRGVKISGTRKISTRGTYCCAATFDKTDDMPRFKRNEIPLMMITTVFY